MRPSRRSGGCVFGGAGAPAIFDFSRTHWSQISEVARGRPQDPADEPAWEDAWTYLRQRFEPAMHAVARRALRAFGGNVVSVDHDRDVVQEFFRQCLEKRWLEKAAPQFGRFRAFVFVMVRRFARKYVDWMRARKRAPSGGWISLDSMLEGFDPAASEASDESLVEWVRCLLDSANQDVHARSPDAARVNAEVLRDRDVSSHELQERLGWPPSKVARFRFRGKAMLREQLQRSIEQTVSSRDALSAEEELLRPLLEPYVLV